MQNSKNMIERMPSDCASLSLAAILNPMGLSSHCRASSGGIDTHPVLTKYNAKSARLNHTHTLRYATLVPYQPYVHTYINSCILRMRTFRNTVLKRA
jgi:hypothetical protein